MTPQQQRLMALYGTFDPKEIEAKKKSEQQTRNVITQKGMSVKMTAEECAKKCKSAGIDYMDGYESRVLQYVMSDESVDRAGDIMRMAGCNLKEFKRNRVILRMHDYREFPVGVCLDIFVDGTQLKGSVLFLDDRVDTSGVADRAFRFAKSGVMKACSIGFKGDEVRYPDQKEREELGMKQYGVIFEKWTLMEVSVVPVPANANAMAEAVRKGVLLPGDAEFVEEEVKAKKPKEEEPDDEDGEGEETDPPEEKPEKSESSEDIANRLAGEIDLKEGRTLSTKTRQKLQSIYDRLSESNRANRRLMKECMDELNSLLSQGMEEEPEEEEVEESGDEKSAVGDLDLVSERLRLLSLGVR